jgi:hypothetical protein
MRDFDEYFFENKNILNSPDRSENPLLWREPKAKIAAHSGREVILENNRSAPRKKLPKVGQLLVCWIFRSKFGISDSHHFTS